MFGTDQQGDRFLRSRRTSSKYDYVKVRVWLGSDTSHYYVLSRFLVSRMLTVTRMSQEAAIKVALELKKHLVDLDKLDVSQEEMEELLFKIMHRRGYGDDYMKRYRMMTEFHHLRVPLVVLVCGTACVGKSTIATQLAQRLNLPNVLQTDVICELLRYSQGAPLHPAPLFSRRIDSTSQLIEEYNRESRIVRKGVEGEVHRCLRDGKAVILEGLHLDPHIYLNILRQTSEASLKPKPRQLKVSVGDSPTRTSSPHSALNSPRSWSVLSEEPPGSAATPHRPSTDTGISPVSAVARLASLPDVRPSPQGSHHHPEWRSWEQGNPASNVDVASSTTVQGTGDCGVDGERMGDVQGSTGVSGGWQEADAGVGGVGPEASTESGDGAGVERHLGKENTAWVACGTSEERGSWDGDETKHASGQADANPDAAPRSPLGRRSVRRAEHSDNDRTERAATERGSDSKDGHGNGSSRQVQGSSSKRAAGAETAPEAGRQGVGEGGEQGQPEAAGEGGEGKTQGEVRSERLKKPIVVPIVLAMKEEAHEILLGEYVSQRQAELGYGQQLARETAGSAHVETEAAPSKGEIMAQMNRLQEYLCNYEQQGAKVAWLSASTFTEVLDELHSHILACIEHHMAQ